MIQTTEIYSKFKPNLNNELNELFTHANDTSLFYTYIVYQQEDRSTHKQNSNVFLEKKKRIAKNCRVEKVLLKTKLFTFWLKIQNKPTFKRIMRKICDFRMNLNNGPRNETNAGFTIVMMYISCRFVLDYLLV